MSTHLPLNTPLMRIGVVAFGITLLWFGMSQISVAGLGLMLVGLTAVVGGIAPPWPSLRIACPPLTLARVPIRFKKAS